jgi:hypothetical protein
MGNVICSMMVSLDGYIEGPDKGGLLVQGVLLGSGTLMFPSRVEGCQDLRLVNQRRFASGVVYLRYRRAAPNQ